MTERENQGRREGEDAPMTREEVLHVAQGLNEVAADVAARTFSKNPITDMARQMTPERRDWGPVPPSPALELQREILAELRGLRADLREFLAAREQD